MKRPKTPRQPRIGDMAYRVLCTTCHYGKSFGAGQAGANRAGTLHVQHLPHHVLVVIRETTIAVMSGTDGVDPLL